MESISTIALIGGGGRTGRFVIHKLLQQGHRIRLLLRAPENFNIQSPLIEIIKGDALDSGIIHALLTGCKAVISTVGQRPGEPLVASQATRNIIHAMNEYHIRRYILIAGINVDTPSDKKGPQTQAATAYMKGNFPLIQEDRQNAYSLLEVSKDIDWTLVRVPMIEFTAARANVTVNVEDCAGTKVTAGNIADFLVRELDNSEYYRKAPFIANA